MPVPDTTGLTVVYTTTGWNDEVYTLYSDGTLYVRSGDGSDFWLDDYPEEFTKPNNTDEDGNSFYYPHSRLVMDDSIVRVNNHSTNEYENVNLTEIVFSTRLTEIGYYFCYGCTSLASVSLPTSLTELDSSFRVCTALTSITFPTVNQLTLSGAAFYGCTALSTVSIPVNVIVHDYDKGSVFRECSNLTTINYGGAPQQWEANGFYTNDGVTINYALTEEEYELILHPIPEFPGLTPIWYGRSSTGYVVLYDNGMLYIDCRISALTREKNVR